MTKKQKARIWNRYAVPVIETAAAGIIAGGGVYIGLYLVQALKAFAETII